MIVYFFWSIIERCDVYLLVSKYQKIFCAISEATSAIWSQSDKYADRFYDFVISLADWKCLSFKAYKEPLKGTDFLFKIWHYLTVNTGGTTYQRKWEHTSGHFVCDVGFQIQLPVWSLNDEFIHFILIIILILLFECFNQMMIWVYLHDFKM